MAHPSVADGGMYGSGKYKGFMLSDIFKIDINYFNWMRREIKNSNIQKIINKIIKNPHLKINDF